MNRMRPRRLSVFEQNLYRLDNRCTELVHGIIAERKKVEELQAELEEARTECGRLLLLVENSCGCIKLEQRADHD